jgi:hypothetical protein
MISFQYFHIKKTLKIAYEASMVSTSPISNPKVLAWLLLGLSDG